MATMAATTATVITLQRRVHDPQFTYHSPSLHPKQRTANGHDKDGMRKGEGKIQRHNNDVFNFIFVRVFFLFSFLLSAFFAIRVFAECRWTSWIYNFCTGARVCAVVNVFLFIFSAIRWWRRCVCVRLHFSSLSHHFVFEYNARWFWFFVVVCSSW